MTQAQPVVYLAPTAPVAMAVQESSDLLMSMTTGGSGGAVSSVNGLVGDVIISTLNNPMTAQGDTLYGGTAGVVTRLPGDTSNARKFLREQSVAAVAQAPVWDLLQAGDIPALPYLSSALVLNTIPAPTGDLSLATHKVINLANGAAATDAAAFGQVPVIDTVATDIAQVGTAAAAGATGKVADAGHVHADPNPLPADFGWLAWTADPYPCNSGDLMATGVIYLSSVFLRRAVTVSNLIIMVSTAGSGLVAGQSFGGLYDTSGVLQAVTADQSVAWASGGIKTMAFTVPFSAPAGRYYVALVSNGTTPPTVRAAAAISSTLISNAGLSGATLRVATNGTGTALPAPITLASNVATNALPFAAILT